MTPGLLLVQVAAVFASLLHVLIDVWIGLYGRDDPTTIAEGLTLTAFALLYAWWMSAATAAAAGVRGAVLALAILAFVWAFLGNGVAGLLACFPPCASAFPWQDLAHLSSAVFGGWAAWKAWAAYRQMSGQTQAAPAVTAVALMLASYLTQAMSLAIPFPP